MKAIIDNYGTWIHGSDSEKLKFELDEVIKKAGFTILNFMEHRFEPIGYTAIWLLAESHCALHTFPEEDKTYIELASCNRQMYDEFLRVFKEAFETSK